MTDCNEGGLQGRSAAVSQAMDYNLFLHLFRKIEPQEMTLLIKI